MHVYEGKVRIHCPYIAETRNEKEKEKMSDSIQQVFQHAEPLLRSPSPLTVNDRPACPKHWRRSRAQRCGRDQFGQGAMRANPATGLGKIIMQRLEPPQTACMFCLRSMFQFTRLLRLYYYSMCSLRATENRGEGSRTSIDAGLWSPCEPPSELLTV